MDIGIPREHRPDEHRVGLTPAGVQLLSAGGHPCSIEAGAGQGAGFSDHDFERAGGRIVYSAEEAFRRADLVIKVERPTPEEIGWMREGASVAGFLHLAVCPADQVEAMLSRKITAIAYEMVQDDDGVLPVLAPLSQVAGRMTPQLAATFLQNDHGGKGILLGGAPGVPPAEVVIIGAGMYGGSAAQGFLSAGASVYVLDQSLARLQQLDQMLRPGGGLVTMVSHEFNVRKVVRFADVLVGAVLHPGERAPIVITREMVRSMKARSLIMDISIDQGGCVETSRPTTHRDPIFMEDNVLHYCVPNMTSVVARTATHAFNNAAWPFLWQIAREGLDAALDQQPALRRGLVMRYGTVTSPALAAALSARGIAQ